MTGWEGAPSTADGKYRSAIDSEDEDVYKPAAYKSAIDSEDEGYGAQAKYESAIDSARAKHENEEEKPPTPQCQYVSDVDSTCGGVFMHSKENGWSLPDVAVQNTGDTQSQGAATDRSSFCESEWPHTADEGEVVPNELEASNLNSGLPPAPERENDMEEQESERSREMNPLSSMLTQAQPPEEPENSAASRTGNSCGSIGVEDTDGACPDQGNDDGEAHVKDVTVPAVSEGFGRRTSPSGSTGLGSQTFSSSDTESIPGEIHNGLQKIPPKSQTPRAWNAFFDRDGDGLVRRSPVNHSSITLLREQFADVDDGSGVVTESELLFHMQESLERRLGPLSLELQELLRETVRRRYAEIDLGLHDERIGQDEWIHFMMLRLTSPSHVAAKHLNKHLRAALINDEVVLTRLQSAFEGLVQSYDEEVRRDSWERVFREAGVHEPSEEDLKNYGFLTYFEFVSHALGAKLAPVQLAMYDTSDGLAKWIPSALLGGHKFDAIWHTGVRVFGKEFWYGGGAFCQAPENVPFGKPVRIIELGKTLRTYTELQEFLHFDLLYTFNRASYDVLHHNCNDFSNEVVRFLLHGQQIPEEVRMQPEWAKNAALTQVLKPILQERLGSFGEDSRLGLTRQCDDVTEEWRRRLRKGDMALFRASYIERPYTVKIMSELLCNGENGVVYPDDACFVDIATFVPSTQKTSNWASWAEWKLVNRSNVEVSHLYPCFEDTQASIMHLQLGLHLDSNIGKVLRRYVIQAWRPVCAKGHLLQDVSANLFTQGSCSICGVKRRGFMAGGSTGSSCRACSFEVCSQCLEEGCSFRGGGVFADILTPFLALDLLASPGWLKYKIRCYYFKAECNASGSVAVEEATKLFNRLRIELGLAALCVVDSQVEINLCRQLNTDQPRPIISTSPAHKNKESVELDIFERLFSHTLMEAMAAGNKAVPFDPGECEESRSRIRSVLAKMGDNCVVAL